MIEPAVGVNPVMPGWPGFVSAYPYGLLGLDVAPTENLLTLAQLKLHLRVPTDQTDEDDLIAAIGLAAQEFCERNTERAFLTQTWTLYLDSFPWWRAPIMLPKPPCQAVLSIKYYDTDGTLQTWDASNYVVMAPQGPTAPRAQIVPAPGVSYPLLPSFALTQRRPNSVQVQFRCGWTTAALVPAGLQAAQKLLAANWYQNREAAQIIRGSADTLPFGVDALLAPYRIVVY